MLHLCDHMTLDAHTWTHTLNWKRLFFNCCLFVCQSSHPEGPVPMLNSDPVSVCVWFLFFSVRKLCSGMLHRAGYCLTYGFCCSALSREKGQAGSLRMELLVLIQFPSSPVDFKVSRDKLGYCWSLDNGVTGPSTGSPRVSVSCCNFWVSSEKLVDRFVGER